MRELPAMPCEPQTVASGEELVGVFGEPGRFGRLPSRAVAGMDRRCRERLREGPVGYHGPDDGSPDVRRCRTRERSVGDRAQSRRLNAFDRIARVEHERPRHRGHGEIHGEVEKDRQNEAAADVHARSVIEHRETG